MARVPEPKIRHAAILILPPLPIPPDNAGCPARFRPYFHFFGEGCIASKQGLLILVIPALFGGNSRARVWRIRTANFAAGLGAPGGPSNVPSNCGESRKRQARARTLGERYRNPASK